MQKSGSRRRRIIVLALAVLAATAIRPSADVDQPDRFRDLARASLAKIEGDVLLRGLKSSVDVIRDKWGVPHIYAGNVDDLFFAQGFVAAQDRLWQMEMWRRQREGRLAEILGPAAVARDRTARMLKYRGPMDDRVWINYHPDGKRIFSAFAAGVNAFITASGENLPVEFKVTGITPEPWTAETVVLHSATFGGANAELQLARDVARLGLAAVNEQRLTSPPNQLTIPQGLDVAAIDESVTTQQGGGRGGGRGGRGSTVPELIEPYRSWLGRREATDPDAATIKEPGSNNWVVAGALSATGKPVVVNDPHREVTNPSLRYIVHLVAPGWNVIGAVEPPFVGVAIGHNEFVAWGLTIVGTDMEDVYVEELNPLNPNEVRFRGAWEAMRVVTETIRVKGEAPQTVELKYTRHGPVFHEDRAKSRAYALRSAWLEAGSASYLAGLRLAQATDCQAFLAAAMYWYAPSENLICGDTKGNISWQASALTPKRTGWSGRLPVPGTGGFEWDGFRKDLPRAYNPKSSYIATANNDIHPPGFDPPTFYMSAAPQPFDRISRIRQMIEPGKKCTLDDHKRMQLDSLHLRAESELPLFLGWTSADPAVERAREMLAKWNARLERDSAAAALHAAWRAASTTDERNPRISLDRRQAMHEASLTRAIAQLTQSQGADWGAWRWGRQHTRAFPHELLALFSLPTVERPGGAGTVAADGASYRQILDVSNWDRSIVTNVPGQSGQPESPFYGNLLPLWSADQYFPLVFSRAGVEREAAKRMRLRPQ